MVDLAVQRLEACSFTVATVHEQLVDPEDSERRADLLLASERLMAEVLDLVVDLRTITWPDNEPFPVRDLGEEIN
jgi:hypothetical protein